MNIINRLKRRIELKNNKTSPVIVTIRLVNSGHSKGMTGIYFNKFRVAVVKNKADLIKTLIIWGS
tara:strand:+ start:134 stop:328 length:195 start_codon:yes stop_codon:yes gene_type:complete